ncbi:hypothetical protein, partial [Sphingomonas bacterium]|uniref:hypothetical protein n=1 Tax=Sphingomonas bacterium TaxID=1895847 RepID=UPI0015773810
MPLPILAWAVFAAASRSPVFNPPLDRPYRVVIHQERAQSGVTRRYELERRLIFHRNGAALVAEMTLVRVWQDSGGDAGRRFEMAAGALKDRIVRFRLAADGAVTSVDDEAALWAATLAGVAATASAAGGDDP